MDRLRRHVKWLPSRTSQHGGRTFLSAGKHGRFGRQNVCPPALSALAPYLFLSRYDRPVRVASSWGATRGECAPQLSVVVAIGSGSDRAELAQQGNFGSTLPARSMWKKPGKTSGSR